MYFKWYFSRIIQSVSFMVVKTLDLILSFLTSIKNCEVKKFRSGTVEDTQETSKTLSLYQLLCYLRGTLVLSVPSVLCGFFKEMQWAKHLAVSQWMKSWMGSTLSVISVVILLGFALKVEANLTFKWPLLARANAWK